MHTFDRNAIYTVNNREANWYKDAGVYAVNRPTTNTDISSAKNP
jgi:hypothetical protein